MAAADANVELTLVVADQAQRDFDLSAMCVRLDGGAVMLTDVVELGGDRLATRRARVTAGAHEMTMLASFHEKDGKSYAFEVKTTHAFVVPNTKEIRANVYETARDVPLQDRLRVEWSDH